MKKIFYTIATLAVLVVASSCGRRATEVEAAEVDSTTVEVVDTVAVADSVVE